MGMYPAAPHRDRRFGTRRSSLLLTAVALAAASSVVPPAGAQTVQDVLKKVDAVYAKAKSYQGSLVAKRTGKAQGKAFTLTQTQQIKYVSPNLFRVEVSVAGTGAAAAAKNSGSTVVSDGKNIYVYSPAQKQYMKQAAPPQLPLRQLLASVIPGASTANAKLAAPTSVNGRPAFVLEIKPQAPPTMTPEQKTKFAQLKPIQVMVDKQSYQVVKIHQSAAEASLDVSFTGQTVNPSIPNTTFAWTVPAGAKEFVRPAAPPGATGAPGGLPPGVGGAPK